jgi:hypothetical protein
MRLVPIARLRVCNGPRGNLRIDRDAGGGRRHARPEADVAMRGEIERWRRRASSPRGWRDLVDDERLL